jgi:hypothetical protein
MKTAALRLITVALACAAVATPFQDRSFDPRVAGEWASAVVSVLAADAYGYGPGYNYSPGYAFNRGPDIGMLAMVLHAPARPSPPRVRKTQRSRKLGGWTTNRNLAHTEYAIDRGADIPRRLCCLSKMPVSSFELM